MKINKLAVASFIVGVIMPFTPLLAHAQEVTLDATTAANVNAAAKSIPDTGISFIMANVQNSLPFILTMVGIGLAIYIVSKLLHKGKGHL